MVLRWRTARAGSASKSVDNNDDDSGHRVNGEDSDQTIEAGREHDVEFIQ